MKSFARQFDPGVDEWQRTMGAWHVVFAALAVLTAVLLVGGAPAPLGSWELGGALVLLVALAGCYSAVGGRALHREPGWAGLGYVGAAAVLTVGLYAVSPVGALMLFVLYPHIWVLLPLRHAMTGTVITIAAVSMVTLTRTGLDPDGLMNTFLPAGVALLIALSLGLWITRIINQSRQRARLVAELAETRAQLAAVSRDAGALAERQRLARDIHDTLTQGFASLVLLLEAAESQAVPDPEATRVRLHRALEVARDNTAQARALVGALTPPELCVGSLPEALSKITERAEARTGTATAFTVTGSAQDSSAEQDVVLLRATQEALANAAKHAAASRIDVALSYREDGVRLEVRDNGRGFDPAVSATGFGLRAMRTRVFDSGGRMSVHTATGCGVCVRIDFPGETREPAGAAR